MYFPEHDGDWRLVGLESHDSHNRVRVINIIGLLEVYDTFTLMVASQTGTKPNLILM
jgi:hypothetical protein